MRIVRRFTLIFALSAALFAITGCAQSNTGTTPVASTAASNAADVMFAQMMIPHHQQAVEMSAIILAKTGVDQRIVDLAQKIRQAQQPEIDQLADLLTAWGASTEMMPGMNHGTTGMLSANDLALLASASGAEAGKIFVQQMIEHHEGAIEMAKTEIAHGSHVGVMTMARAIVDAQTAEITVMKDLLPSL